eukprot:178667-Chlamydomonas_euryale.AAC.1
MSTQHTSTHIVATGSETANQDSQLGGCPSMLMRSIAKMFWGDEMGDVMPPMLDASAMPMTRLLAKELLGSSVLHESTTGERRRHGIEGGRNAHGQALGEGVARVERPA